MPIKTVDHQAIQQLHRLRTQWMRTRTARINLLRGMLREFGIAIPLGVLRAIERVRAQLAMPDAAVPLVLQPGISELLAEIGELEQRCALR